MSRVLALTPLILCFNFNPIDTVVPPTIVFETSESRIQEGGSVNVCLKVISGEITNPTSITVRPFPDLGGTFPGDSGNFPGEGGESEFISPAFREFFHHNYNTSL